MSKATNVERFKWKSQLQITNLDDFKELEQYSNDINTYYEVANMEGLSDEQRVVAMCIVIMLYKISGTIYHAILGKGSLSDVLKYTYIGNNRDSYISGRLNGMMRCSLHRIVCFGEGGGIGNLLQVDHIGHQFDHQKCSLEVVKSQSHVTHSFGVATVSSAKELMELLSK